jgi:hypothetical protein
MFIRKEYRHPDGYVIYTPPKFEADAMTYLWVYPHPGHYLRNKNTGMCATTLHIRVYELEQWEEIPDNSH